MISLLTAGLLYQLGINEYINFPKEYPKDYLVYALSIVFCSILMTYNQHNQEKKSEESEKLGN